MEVQLVPNYLQQIQFLLFFVHVIANMLCWLLPCLFWLLFSVLSSALTVQCVHIFMHRKTITTLELCRWVFSFRSLALNIHLYLLQVATAA